MYGKWKDRTSMGNQRPDIQIERTYGALQLNADYMQVLTPSTASSRKQKKCLLTLVCCHAEYILYITHIPNFYPITLHHSSFKHAFSIRVVSSVDPDQLASSTDLILQCFQNRLSPGLAL